MPCPVVFRGSAWSVYRDLRTRVPRVLGKSERWEVRTLALSANKQKKSKPTGTSAPFRIPKLHTTGLKISTPHTPQYTLGFCGRGEVEKELSAARLPAGQRQAVGTALGRHTEAGEAGRGKSPGRSGAGGSAAGSRPTPRYLLQKQPDEVLVRAAGLTALPHVGRRHQPLTGRETLRVHTGGGSGGVRTVDTRTHTHTQENRDATRRPDGTATPRAKFLRLVLAHAQSAPESVPETDGLEHARRAPAGTEREPRLAASDWSG